MTTTRLEHSLGTVRLVDERVDLDFVARLRSQVERSARSTWECEGGIPAGLASALQHLMPPHSGGGEGGDLWRTLHSVGGCYYRVGPSFLSIRERRDGYEAAVFKVRDPDLIDCVTRLADAPTSHRCESCDMLDDFDLVLSDGTDRLFLPTRLHYPPVPFLSV